MTLNAYQCANCRKPLPKQDTGRRRRFCSDRCRSHGRRNPTYETRFSVSVAPDSPDVRNANNSHDISTSCEGEMADRALLIKRAHELEYAARWPTTGLRK